MRAVPVECWALLIGFALDARLGDPRGWPHPVRLIGWLIVRTERGLRAVGKVPPRCPRTDVGLEPGDDAAASSVIGHWSTGSNVLEFLAGVVLLAVVAGTTGGAVWASIRLAARGGFLSVLTAESLLRYWGLAVRSLAEEALRASDEADLVRAREELAMIVGRDTNALDRAEVCRACVETVAENANDAVIAPLFWFAVGGPVGLWVYKAVNTLDSMVGYRDDRYRRLGWASARFDDLLGLVPARLTWLLVGLSSCLVGEDARGALRVGWRDGRKHPSPNAAWGEAAMAGALGVRLGGPATYHGVVSEKPRLGDHGPPIGPATVRRAVRVMVGASLIAGALGGFARFWVLTRA